MNTELTPQQLTALETAKDCGCLTLTRSLGVGGTLVSVWDEWCRRARKALCLVARGRKHATVVINGDSLRLRHAVPSSAELTGEAQRLFWEMTVGSDDAAISGGAAYWNVTRVPVEQAVPLGQALAGLVEAEARRSGAMVEVL